MKFAPGRFERLQLRFTALRQGDAGAAVVFAVELPREEPALLQAAQENRDDGRGGMERVGEVFGV